MPFIDPVVVNLEGDKDLLELRGSALERAATGQIVIRMLAVGMIARTPRDAGTGSCLSSMNDPQDTTYHREHVSPGGDSYLCVFKSTDARDRAINTLKGKKFRVENQEQAIVVQKFGVQENATNTVWVITGTFGVTVLFCELRRTQLYQKSRLPRSYRIQFTIYNLPFASRNPPPGGLTSTCQFWTTTFV